MRWSLPVRGTSAACWNAAFIAQESGKRRSTPVDQVYLNKNSEGAGCPITAMPPATRVGKEILVALKACATLVV